MSTIGLKQPGCRLRDRFAAAVFVLAVPSIALAVENGICLPVLNQAAPAAGSIGLGAVMFTPGIGPATVGLRGLELFEVAHATVIAQTPASAPMR